MTPSETVIEVASKPGTADPAGHGLLADIRHLGVKGVKSVSTAQLYQLIGPLTIEDQTRIAQDLLCDPIIQQWRVASHGLRPPSPVGRGTAVVHPSPGGRGDGGEARLLVIDVWLKPGVTDVVGDSVIKGIRDLGITRVTAVRTGVRYRLLGLTRQETADRITLSCLANPLVQEYSIHADA